MMIGQTLIFLFTNTSGYEEPIEQYEYVRYSYYEEYVFEQQASRSRKKLPVIDLSNTTPMSASPIKLTPNSPSQKNEKELR